jgi:single stranded DNA-binding protein (ssb)
MNKVSLIGRLTKDVELRYTQNGVACVMFTLAVDRQFKDNQGNRVCDFISCVAWRTQAEFLSKYAGKGNIIALSGSIQTRQFQDQSQSN